MHRPAVTAVLALLLAQQPFAPARACEEDIALAGLHAYLLGGFSGTLSDDLLARPEPFIGWNTPIGEGDALEAASDLLVVVDLSATGEVFVDEPLEIWLEDEAGDEFARRRIDGLLTSGEGKAAFALYAPDSTCKGTITIHAKFRGDEKSGTLQLQCGE